MTTDCVGGVWTYTVQLTRALTTRGAKVFVAAIGPKPTALQKREIQSIDVAHFAHFSHRLEWMEGGCEDLKRCSRWLLDLEESFSPDVIHSNSYGLADAPFYAPVLVVGHSCVYSWWRAVHGSTPPAEWSGYRSAVTAGLRSAAAVVGPTRSMLHSLTSNYDVQFTHSRIIHNGSQAPEMALPSKQPIILAAGRVWDESKNFSVLDKIAHNIQCSIRIAGATESPEGRPAFLPRRVRLLGPVSQQELHQSMCQASVFAHPALYEPFGLAILEAAQRGCALVLSDIPSLRELWDHAALFCPARDAGAWRAGLNTVLNNNELRLDLANRARSRAAQFTLDRMVADYEDLYRTIASGFKRNTRWERAS